MNVLLHDLPASDFENYVSISDKSSYQIVGPTEKAPVKCVGCFGCWIKNPGECTLTQNKQEFSHLCRL